MAEKRPAFQFYPADWRKDAAVQSCSIAARGLWHEMLCIAHECEPYGHLTVNGQPMTGDQLARLVGVAPRECAKLLAELERNGVFSRTSEGVIYSRRMVKDEAIRNARASGGEGGKQHGHLGAEHGKKGGRPRKDNGGSKTPLPDPQKPPPSSSSSSSPSGEEGGGGGARARDPDPPVSRETEPGDPVAQLVAADVEAAPSDPSSPPIRPAIPPTSSLAATISTPADPAQRLADDFLASRDRLWPSEPALPAPLSTLRTQVQAWLDEGASPELIGEIVARGMADAARDGKSAPHSFAAYKHSLRNALAEAKKAAEPLDPWDIPPHFRRNGGPNVQGRDRPLTGAAAAFAAAARLAGESD